MDHQMKTVSTLLTAALAIASELGGEITRLRGNLDWTAGMRSRLETLVKNGFPQDTATPDDEKRFYETGLAAIELVMAGVRAEAEKDGLAGDGKDDPAKP